MDEQGGRLTRTFKASRFEFATSPWGDTTDQQTTLTLVNTNTGLYDFLKTMTPAQRQKPVSVRVRLYFTGQVEGETRDQLITPGTLWYVHNVSASRTAIQAELRAELLRTRKAGVYYTATNFPALRWLLR